MKKQGAISFLPNRHKRKGKKDDAVIMRASNKAPEAKAKEKRSVRFAGLRAEKTSAPDETTSTRKSKNFLPITMPGRNRTTDKTVEEQNLQVESIREVVAIEEAPEETREEEREETREEPNEVHEIIEITDEENFHAGLSRVRYQEPPASSAVDGVRELINEQGEAIIDVTDIGEEQYEKGCDPPQIVTRAPTPVISEPPVSQDLAQRATSCDNATLEGFQAQACDTSAIEGLGVQLFDHMKRLGASMVELPKKLSDCTHAMKTSNFFEEKVSISDDGMDRVLGVVKEDLKHAPRGNSNTPEESRDSFIIFLGEELEKATCGIDRNDPNQEEFELIPQEKIDALNRLLENSSALAREGAARSSQLAQQGYQRSSTLALEGLEKTSEFARNTFTVENLRIIFPAGKMEEIKRVLASHQQQYLTAEKFDAVAKMLECGVLTNVIEMKFLEEDPNRGINGDPPEAGRARDITEIDVPEQLLAELAEILECSSPNSVALGRNRSLGINAGNFAPCSIGKKQLDALTKVFLCGLGLETEDKTPRLTNSPRMDYRTNSMEAQQGGHTFDDDSLGDDIYYEPIPRVMGIVQESPKGNRRYRSQEPGYERRREQAQRRYRSEEPTQRRRRSHSHRPPARMTPERRQREQLPGGLSLDKALTKPTPEKSTFMDYLW
jgi:hypothetical protein